MSVDAPERANSPPQPSLFWRALLAFIALPFVVEFVVPWLLRPERSALRTIGLVVIVLGACLQLWCVRDFYVAGRGTLAPWAPPKHLVTIGLYRISRNPMYVSGLIVLCGWALAYASLALWLYAAAVTVAFNLRVFFSEEPWLARTHGEEWTAYRERVPRWFGWRSR